MDSNAFFIYSGLLGSYIIWTLVGIRGKWEMRIVLTQDKAKITNAKVRIGTQRFEWFKAGLAMFLLGILLILGYQLRF